MSFVTEVVEEKPAVLLITRLGGELVRLLKHHLKKYSAEVFSSPVLQKKLERFEYIFFLNESPPSKINLNLKHKKITFIYLNSPTLAKFAQKHYHGQPIKIISIRGDKITDDHIDKVLWFTFSEAKENYLQLAAARNSPLINTPWHLAKIKVSTRKKIIIVLLFVFLFLHVSFIPPLCVSSYLLYKSTQDLKQGTFLKAEKNYELGSALLMLAKKFYQAPRASFLFFSLTFPDNLFKNIERGEIIVQKSLNLQKNGKEVLKLVFKKDKTAEEKRLLALRLETIKKSVDLISANLVDLGHEIPAIFPNANSIKSDLDQYIDIISRFKKILPHLDSVLAKGSEKTYLLLFANNMELRPGGGFIGSFGVMKVKDYTIEQIKIYDVYDADGQLLAHVEPPAAIREYLGQPNWFLRDSAFSPDLLENYAQAKYFLEHEMGFKDFSGVFLITTSTVQNILTAFPELYLSDFNEKINQKNFYLKTQYYSEKNFFPGSTQKKNFLGALTKSILIELENAEPQKLAKAIKKSLDEKQLAVYFDDPKLQKTLTAFYWSGRTIVPTCEAQNENCINDYIFPIDANLGLNKVNFFVSRYSDLKVTIDKNGEITNIYSLKFNNDSQDAFPGGTYRNYFQIFLPRASIIKSITKDGVVIEDYTKELAEYTKIGFLIEVKPKSIVDVKINYKPTNNLKKGKNIYQLIAQRQIGSSNSDLRLELVIDKKIHLLNQNFPALVKDNRIVYNTSLSTDKIFLVELIKE